MRRFILPLLALALIGCGSRDKAAPAASAAQATPAPSHANMPADDVHAGLMAPGQTKHEGSLNTEIHLSDAVRNAWRGIKVRIVDTSSGNAQEFDVPLGQTEALGDSGLSLTAKTFIPDFVMDPSGITSRSDEPNNPAASVVITEEGKDPYTGWLFAALPDIHPFPHDRYQVLLVEGLPAS
jgi:hypothetical protein